METAIDFSRSISRRLLLLPAVFPSMILLFLMRLLLHTSENIFTTSRVSKIPFDENSKDRWHI